MCIVARSLVCIGYTTKEGYHGAEEKGREEETGQEESREEEGGQEETREEEGGQEETREEEGREEEGREEEGREEEIAPPESVSSCPPGLDLAGGLHGVTSFEVPFS